jgi:branched-chain amino acid transport system substrate-binding protein
MRGRQIAVALAAATALAGCGASGSSKPASQAAPSQAAAGKAPIKIGVMTNDTGAYAPLGSEVRNAVQMVINQVNQQGGVNGHPIDAIYLDGQTNPNLAVTQAKQLVADHVVAVLGLEFGTAAHAAVPIFEQAHIPVIVNTADEAVAEPPNPWVFDVSTVTKIQDARMASYLACKHITQVASLHDTEALGEEGNRDLKQLASQYHFQVVVDQPYDLTAKNLVNQLTAIGRSPAQAIVYWGVGTAPAIVVKEYHQLGLKIPLLASAANADPTFLKEVGSDANGMLVAATPSVMLQHLPKFTPHPHQLLAFAQAYQQTYHQPMGELAGLGHDAAAMLVHVMQQGALTPASIDAKLNHLTYSALNGTWKFTPDNHVGLQVSDVVMARIVNGEAVATACQ